MLTSMGLSFFKHNQNSLGFQRKEIHRNENCYYKHGEIALRFEEERILVSRDSDMFQDKSGALAWNLPITLEATENLPITLEVTENIPSTCFVTKRHVGKLKLSQKSDSFIKKNVYLAFGQLFCTGACRFNNPYRHFAPPPRATATVIETT